MNHRTPLLTLFIAGALATTAAYAQDATTATDATQQAQPVPTQVDASAQQSTSVDASTAAAAQGKTSGDASGIATTASATSAYDASSSSDNDKKDQDAEPKSTP